jgi:hypothetical protein
VSERLPAIRRRSSTSLFPSLSTCPPLQLSAPPPSPLSNDPLWPTSGARAPPPSLGLDRSAVAPPFSGENHHPISHFPFFLGASPSSPIVDDVSTAARLQRPLYVSLHCQTPPRWEEFHRCRCHACLVSRRPLTLFDEIPPPPCCSSHHHHGTAHPGSPLASAPPSRPGTHACGGRGLYEPARHRLGTVGCLSR